MARPRALDERAARFAGGLAAKGVRKGDRVALLCCDEHEGDYAVAYLALYRLGAIPVIVPDDREGALTALRSIRLRGAVACLDRSGEWEASRRHGIFVGHLTYNWWWPIVERTHGRARALTRSGIEIGEIRVDVDGGTVTERIRTVDHLRMSSQIGS